MNSASEARTPWHEWSQISCDFVATLRRVQAMVHMTEPLARAKVETVDIILMEDYCSLAVVAHLAPPAARESVMCSFKLPSAVDPERFDGSLFHKVAERWLSNPPNGPMTVEEVTA